MGDDKIICDLSHGDISNDLDGPSIQGHGIFEVKYVKNGAS